MLYESVCPMPMGSLPVAPCIPGATMADPYLSHFQHLFFPLQNMLSFCTASPKSLQTLKKYDRRLKQRPTGSRGPTKAFPQCPSTCGSTRRTVGSMSTYLSWGQRKADSVPVTGQVGLTVTKNMSPPIFFTYNQPS